MSKSKKTKTPSKEELRAQNLEWFRTQFPAIHQQIEAYEPMSELIDEGDGWHNVSFSGQLLYDPSAKEVIEAQLDNFNKQPDRLSMAPVQPTSFDKYAANYLHNIVEQIAEKDIEISQFIPGTQAYYAFVFGFGLGAHINELVEKSTCQVLFIVEPHFEFIYQSLTVFDWVKLHETMDARGGYFDVIISESPDEIFERVKGIVRKFNPCSTDGLIFFTNYNNANFSTVQHRVRVDQHLILSGLGFYFDETVMIANNHQNFCSGDATMTRYSIDKIRKHPAFVVASGPSLDKDIEWIKKNTENAVIFSCGSAIMPLLRNGIQPDFHVELENIPELYDMMVDTAKYVDLSKTHMLATSTIDPRVPDFFEKTSYFFRPALSSYPIFARDEDAPLHNGSPSVANAALALAQNFGFREMYLFGIDMGSKRVEALHSKHAWQNSDEGTEVNILHNIPVRGNFGGTVYTYQGMNWTRDELELGIKAFHKGRHYYNCSDGAFIAGTIAKYSRSIKFKPISTAKSLDVKSIEESFASYSKEDFEAKWNDAEMQKSFKDYCDALLDCFEDPDDLQSKHSLTMANKILSAARVEKLQIGLSMIFRGTIWQALLAAEYYLIRIDGEEERKLATQIYKDETTKLLHHLRDMAIDDLGHLSEHEWAPRERKLEIEREEW